MAKEAWQGRSWLESTAKPWGADPVGRGYARPVTAFGDAAAVSLATARQRIFSVQGGS
jgi:hypothetical protein